MLVPMNWLREMTPYEGSAQDLGALLTMRGLELEDIINPFAAIMGIKVGYVAQCVKHPDSDHLHCCKVDMGGNELLDIVCGAPNVAEGQKVAVAMVGTRMPDGTVIKKTKLRGQPSHGMICSERELGLGDDHSGIMVLPESADVGHPLVDALYMDTEALDLSITPNRGDCLSILGIARETAAALKLPLHLPELPVIENFQLPHREVPVEIDDPELCHLYAGRVVSGLKTAPAPMRMRYRLLAAGMRPVSNIVDATNYVMLECGQPLHAFDLDKLAGDRIIVRPARKGEKLVTLDGQDRKLATRDLCICDANGPVALAGVMGGLNTEIDANSKNVFLESAVFDPRSVRLTSRRLGLVSEASYRFERGIDQGRSTWALDRAASLIASIGGGNVLHGFSIAEPRPFRPRHIPYKPEAGSRLLGGDIPDSFQKEALLSLGCAVESGGQAGWIVVQPSWRHDLERPADIVEEVGRSWGLDRIEPVLPPVRRNLKDFGQSRDFYSFITQVKAWGAGLGLHEVINYSFVGHADLDRLRLEKEGRVSIFNPLSEEQNVLRSCLAPGLLQSCASNLAYGSQDLRIFEVAKAFSSSEKHESRVGEKPLLGILLTGQRHAPRWPHKREEMDYADLKGLCENLFNFLHLESARYETLPNHPFLQPSVGLSINGESIGVLGCVQPEIADAWQANRPVWLAELDLTLLYSLNQASFAHFSPLPLYPAVRRDITVSAPHAMKAQELLDTILAMKMPLLEGAVLADMYLPQDKPVRNLTFRLTFRHGSRTLKDAEVDREREKIAEHLRKKHAVEI